MRRTAAFLAVVLVVLALIVAVEWRVDAFGDIYRGGALAEAQRSGCLVSDDLVGPAGLFPLKDDLVRRDRPREVVVGTSRALKIRARPGENGFVNYAIPGTRPDLTPFFRRLHQLHPGPLTVLVSTEYFWFNANWAWSGYVRSDESFRPTVRRLLTRQRLDATLARLRDDPVGALEQWHRVTVGGHCALDRQSRLADGQVDAWRTDGSLVYRFELSPKATPAEPNYQGQLGLGNKRFGGGYYNDFRVLAPKALAGLARSLALARSYGWRVVGYSPPYSDRYSQRLATAPETVATWTAFGPAMKQLYGRYGFPFVDLRSVHSVPCRNDQFADDGWHPDDACSDKVRRRVEAALKS